MRTLTNAQLNRMEAKKAKRLAMMEAVKQNEPSAETVANARFISIDGHEYSGRNKMFLAMQQVEFGKLGGFQQWIAHGRAVKKGETGNDIMIPCSKKAKDGGDDETFFRWISIFHENQTEPILATQ